MITILRGCPGCGKTTYINNLISEGKEFVVVSSDGIRQMMWGMDYDFAETDLDLVYDSMREIIKLAKEKHDVIIEATNINPIEKLLSIYRLDGKDTRVVDVNYKITFEQCLENVRNRTRDNDISEEKLKEMYDRWQEIMKEGK